MRAEGCIHLSNGESSLNAGVCILLSSLRHSVQFSLILFSEPNVIVGLFVPFDPSCVPCQSDISSMLIVSPFVVVISARKVDC